MTLTCECPDYDYYDCEWWYENTSDYHSLATKRGRRCKSCKAIIKPGEICTSHGRYRHTNTFIEEMIYDCDGVPLAPHWMCERCSDLFFSLQELGYCVSPEDDMRVLINEYKLAHETGLTNRSDNDV